MTIDVERHFSLSFKKKEKEQKIHEYQIDNRTSDQTVNISAWEMSALLNGWTHFSLNLRNPASCNHFYQRYENRVNFLRYNSTRRVTCFTLLTVQSMTAFKNGQDLLSPQRIRL